MKKEFTLNGSTIEKFMEFHRDDKVKYFIEGMKYDCETLMQLYYSVQTALERETDPARRQLLDGRKNK